MARWLIVVGAVSIALGIALHYAPGLFGWIGRLPGDLRIDTERSRVFIPLTSMVVISVVVTLAIYLFRR